MRPAVVRSRIGPHFIQPRLDANPEIDLRMPDQGQLSMECALRVSPAIDAYDELTAPAEELVKSHILDVTAVGHVEPPIFFSHPRSGHLANKAKKARPAARSVRRIPDPIAQAYIQKRHQR
jgi:hypothetical protein